MRTWRDSPEHRLLIRRRKIMFVIKGVLGGVAVAAFVAIFAVVVGIVISNTVYDAHELLKTVTEGSK